MMMPKGVPLCGRCKRPVQQLYRDEDIFRDTIVFVAECHGEREQTVLESQFLASLPYDTKVTFGVAFKQQVRPVRR